MKRIFARFFMSDVGNEPVRDWLLSLPRDDKKIIGADIKTVEYGWPIGMPVCKPLGSGLYEVRSNLASRRISRVIFCIHENEMILLHAFIKKDQKAPLNEISLARQRKGRVENEDR